MKTKRLKKFKRRLKWQKPLTVQQLRHLDEWQQTLTLRDFRRQRETQKRQAAKFDTIEACWTCFEIERRLVEAGVLK